MNFVVGPACDSHQKLSLVGRLTCPRLGPGSRSLHGPKAIHVILKEHLGIWSHGTQIFSPIGCVFRNPHARVGPRGTQSPRPIRPTKGPIMYSELFTTVHINCKNYIINESFKLSKLKFLSYIFSTVCYTSSRIKKRKRKKKG